MLHRHNVVIVRAFFPPAREPDAGLATPFRRSRQSDSCLPSFLLVMAHAIPPVFRALLGVRAHTINGPSKSVARNFPCSRMLRSKGSLSR